MPLYLELDDFLLLELTIITYFDIMKSDNYATSVNNRNNI